MIKEAVSKSHRPWTRRKMRASVYAYSPRSITVYIYICDLHRWASPWVTAPYFYGSILLQALKSKILVVLTYTQYKIMCI
jgi:hypothetical protein